MPSRRRWLGLLLGALGAVPSLAAQDEPLTLSQALALADRDNPELQAARERAAAQLARADAEGDSVWPRLWIASGWSLSDNPALVFAQKLNAGEFRQQDFAIDRLNSPDAAPHLTTTLGADLTLDVFGKVGRQADRLHAQGRAASAGARETAAELRLRVVVAYWQADLARRAVAVGEGALEGARAREADIEARVAEGVALEADRLRARARRRKREAELAEFRGQARTAAAVLARLLGAPAGVSYRPVDVPPAPAPLAGDEGQWGARALANRASLDAARQQLEAARREAEHEQRGLLPDLFAYGQIQDDRSSFEAGSHSGTVGVTLRWSAFDRTRGRRGAAAQAGVRAAELELAAAQAQARLEVEQALRRAEAARERYAAALGGAAEGREALRVVRERRENGLATLTDELETEAASLAAELEELEAAAGAASADAALGRAAGENEEPRDAETP